MSIDERDEVVGRAPAERGPPAGPWHRAVHVLVFDGRGRVFLQLRSMREDTTPGCWDSSCSGHVDSGEGYDEAARRRAAEEIGVAIPAPPPVVPGIGARAETGWEFVWVYRLENEGPFVLAPDEIDRGDGLIRRRSPACPRQARGLRGVLPAPGPEADGSVVRPGDDQVERGQEDVDLPAEVVDAVEAAARPGVAAGHVPAVVRELLSGRQPRGLPDDLVPLDDEVRPVGVLDDPFPAEERDRPVGGVPDRYEIDERVRGLREGSRRRRGSTDGRGGRSGRAFLGTLGHADKEQRNWRPRKAESRLTRAGRATCRWPGRRRRAPGSLVRPRASRRTASSWSCRRPRSRRTSGGRSWSSVKLFW